MASGGKVVVKIDGDTSGFKNAFEKMKGFAGAAAKGIGIAFGAAAAAVGTIGTAAVKAYGDFEQLVGGVDTLFKENSQQVQKYADEAYKTAGLSANQYMETITGFSASLLQSLGNDTAKAAEYGNQAVIDMSDNANKMGTSMEMIQNAYQGFAKQNYTMLDNLKLGYGGTKEEMQRLLDDASKLSGIEYDISSFADITQAIHVIQTEMGITGTTAEEAATTLQGSLGMVKASWENLMIGLTDPDADLDTLMQQFTESVMTFADNLIPVISRAIESLPKMIQSVGTSLINELPNLVNVLLPQLASMASQLVTVLSDSLSQNADMLGSVALSVLMTFVDTILQNLPQLIGTALTLILTLAQGIAQALPDLIPSVVDTILTIVDTLLDNIDMLVDVALELIIALAEGLMRALPKLIEKIPEIILKLDEAIITNAPKLFKAGWQLLITLGVGLVKAIPSVIKNIPALITAMCKTFTLYSRTVSEIGKNIVSGIWEGIKNAKNWLMGKIKEWCGNLLKGIKSFFGIHSPSTVMRDEVGKMIALGLANGIEDNRSEVQKAMDEMNEKLLDSEVKYQQESERLKDSQSESDKRYLENLKTIAEKERKIYDALQKDIENAQKSTLESIKTLADEAMDSIEDIEKLQNDMANKLKEFGDLYTSKTKKTWRGEIEVIELADIEKQTKAIEEYADSILKIKERGNVPQEFFSVLRDLSVEEGTKFADALLRADNTAFEKYIADWEQKQRVSEELSKILYADEAEKVKNEINESFDKFNEDLDLQGKHNAEAWGEGFSEKVKQIIPQILDEINSAFGNIIGTPSYAIAGNTRNGGTFDLSKIASIKRPIRVYSTINLNDREVGRSIGSSITKENNRKGSSFIK